MLRKRSLHAALLLALVVGAVAVGLARSGRVAGQDAASPAAGHHHDATDVQAKIADAVRAAPSSVSAEAAVVDYAMDAAGHFVVLREGSNDWTCFPDTPGTPSDDPQCLDQTWMDWMYAYMAGTAPTTTVPGLGYMLQGGTDASNTDPFATEVAAGEEWVVSPPHVMIILPGKLDQTVFTTDYRSGQPWIMFAGTPFEHLMVPVADGENAG
jgi:hypothetical protein